MTALPLVEMSGLSDGQAAALLFAIDPHGFGGVVVRSRAGPNRDQWLGQLRAMLPAGVPVHRLPAGTAEARLDGSLDLVATLAAGRPVLDRGLLAHSDGGVILVPMAERLPESVAARLGAALDTGVTSAGAAARFGVVAFDEGVDGEAVSGRLIERLAFWLEPALSPPAAPLGLTAARAEEARRRAAGVDVSEDVHRSLAATAAALGIDSLRPPILALRVARLAAALAGRSQAVAEDASLAARLVLAPRATRVPAAPDQQTDSPTATESPPDGTTEERPENDRSAQAAPVLDDLVLAAARSALPPGLLLGLEVMGRTARQKHGGTGATQVAPNRGRPAGMRRGVPRAGARLNLIDTLRAAAPWQPVRRAIAQVRPEDAHRLLIRSDDFRLTRFKQRTGTVTLFAVDASGSLALQRLNEAKGAVELLLAECYVRRDQVALLAFRGKGAELLLPPTRSLARAKRSLASLPGGGATPLPAALDAVIALADTVRRRGRTPVIVLFTDGRANVARDGTVDRARAEAETQAAARLAAQAKLQILLIDAAPRPQARARDLASALNATYLPLPRADATTLTAAIRQVPAT